MRETIGVFMLVKDEIQWVRPWLERLLPFVDQFVLFDGDSIDGTIETINDLERNHPNGGRINLYLDKNPKDLRDDYVRLFDEALHCLSTDWAFFCHPDMALENPEALTRFLETSHGEIAASTNMRSFAGDPGGPLFEIQTGRGDKWKNLMRLKNPSLGLHYFGHYGNGHEDMYFRAITGDEHRHYGHFFKHYPYEIVDSGINIRHFSDVRPYKRRLSRMKTCLLNQGHKPEIAEKMAAEHPRVTLKDDAEFRFVPAEYPDYFIPQEPKCPV